MKGSNVLMLLMCLGFAVIGIHAWVTEGGLMAAVYALFGIFGGAVMCREIHSQKESAMTKSGAESRALPTRSARLLSRQSTRTVYPSACRCSPFFVPQALSVGKRSRLGTAMASEKRCAKCVDAIKKNKRFLEERS